MKKYVLILWPDSQFYMKYDWFRNESVLAEESGEIGSSAYFIPEERYDEVTQTECFECY